MAVTGFFHAGVTVRDMAQALRFYRDGLGLDVVREFSTGGEIARRVRGFEPGTVRVAFLRVPGSDALIELLEFADVERHPAAARPCDYGAGHLCLYVDDAEALHARMRSLGHRSRTGAVTTIDDGPYAGTKVVYLLDPDGYPVELYQRADR